MSTTKRITSSDTSHYLHHTFFAPTASATEIKATLLVVHGMSEHSGRYADFAQFLADKGIAVATYDQLGHGKTVKSASELGFFGEEHPVQSLLKDVIVMADSLKAKHPEVPHFIMGHSMGSFIVRTVMKHHSQDFAGAILMGSADADPLTKVMLPINKLLAKVAPKRPNTVFAKAMNKIFNSKLDNRISSSDFAWLSENQASIDAYEADPLAGFNFTNNGYMTLFNLMESALNKNWANTIAKDFPMLFVSGKNDPVGNMGKGIDKVVNRLNEQGFTSVEVKLYPHMRHEPLHELEKQLVYQDILEWLNSQLSDPQE